MIKKLILASASPRRQELLKQIGLDFEVIPSLIEEEFHAEDLPQKIVTQLSLIKAKDVANRVGQECIIIGADTIVVYQGKILGKPKDEEDAFEMLSILSGKTHHVFTGITVIGNKGKKIIQDYAETLVTFRGLSKLEIMTYIRTGEPMDKAGAYGIQNIGSTIIEKIEGDYFNVVGLPVMKLAMLLKREFGIKIL